MGAIKRMLPDNWDEIKDEEVELIYVTSTGFAATLTVNSNTVTDNFGHTIDSNKLGSIKDVICRLLMAGFNVGIKTRQTLKKEELT